MRFQPPSIRQIHRASRDVVDRGAAVSSTSGFASFGVRPFRAEPVIAEPFIGSVGAYARGSEVSDALASRNRASGDRFGGA